MGQMVLTFIAGRIANYVIIFNELLLLSYHVF